MGQQDRWLQKNSNLRGNSARTQNIRAWGNHFRFLAPTLSGRSVSEEETVSHFVRATLQVTILPNQNQTPTAFYADLWPRRTSFPLRESLSHEPNDHMFLELLL